MTRQRKGSIRIHKVISDYGVIDYYKHYRSLYSDTKNSIDYKTYKKVLDEIFCGIADAMSYKMYDFKVPFNLGRIITRKYKPIVQEDSNGELFIKRPINWPETKKMWIDYPELESKQYVYYTNPHSLGYIFTLIYRKRGCIFKNKSYYAAQVNRKIKRTIAKQIFNGEFDSLETNNK